MAVRDRLQRDAKTVATTKFGHVRIRKIPLRYLRPSPENNDIYHKINSSDPSMVAMADSIRKYGVRDPLVITLDNNILSGHRRYAAAIMAGLSDVPCRVESNIEGKRA